MRKDNSNSFDQLENLIFSLLEKELPQEQQKLFEEAKEFVFSILEQSENMTQPIIKLSKEEEEKAFSFLQKLEKASQEEPQKELQKLQQEQLKLQQEIEQLKKEKEILQQQKSKSKESSSADNLEERIFEGKERKVLTGGDSQKNVNESFSVEDLLISTGNKSVNQPNKILYQKYTSKEIEIKLVDVQEKYKEEINISSDDQIISEKKESGTLEILKEKNNSESFEKLEKLLSLLVEQKLSQEQEKIVEEIREFVFNILEKYGYHAPVISLSEQEEKKGNSLLKQLEELSNNLKKEKLNELFEPVTITNNEEKEENLKIEKIDEKKEIQRKKSKKDSFYEIKLSEFKKDSPISDLDFMKAYLENSKQELSEQIKFLDNKPEEKIQKIDEVLPNKEQREKLLSENEEQKKKLQEEKEKCQLEYNRLHYGFQAVSLKSFEEMKADIIQVTKNEKSFQISYQIICVKENKETYSVIEHFDLGPNDIENKKEAYDQLLKLPLSSISSDPVLIKAIFSVIEERDQKAKIEEIKRNIPNSSSHEKEKENIAMKFEALEKKIQEVEVKIKEISGNAGKEDQKEQKQKLFESKVEGLKEYCVGKRCLINRLLLKENTQLLQEELSKRHDLAQEIYAKELKVKFVAITCGVESVKQAKILEEKAGQYNDKPAVANVLKDRARKLKKNGIELLENIDQVSEENCSQKIKECVKLLDTSLSTRELEAAVPLNQAKQSIMDAVKAWFAKVSLKASFFFSGASHTLKEISKPILSVANTYSRPL